MSELPPEIGQLQHLTTLHLNNNQLSELPPEIAQLQNLQNLRLNNNQLSELPPEIAQLQNLQSLSLNDNQLGELPPEIAQLQNLETLHLNDNQLGELPSEIFQLQNLQTLWFANNQLSELPPEIAQLQQIHSLDVQGNKLTFPPLEIVTQGWRAIFGYLGNSFARQWVSKLLIVGQGGVGKTQLLRALRNEAFDESIDTTHGIEIRKVQLPHPGRDDIEMVLNAWDFGGQEIYRATHKFFLTNRSLFLLAWNARHGYEQGKLYDWLDSIQARAPESPVIIVSTHIDERDADLPLAEIHNTFPQVVGHVEVSNKNRIGFDRLRELIIKTAIDLPLMGERWPTPWLEAANTLRKNEERSMRPKQLFEQMSESGVKAGNAPILARWLHELGEILYFDADADLKELVILKPQWVSKYISDVLESEEVIEKDGLLTHEHMDDLWVDLDTSIQEHFLRLMEQFDLSYRTLDNKEISLVVERLPLDPPEYEEAWDDIRQNEPCREIAMHFDLSSLQAGLPTWFIARSHRFSTHTHWRTGALFADDRDKRTHLALVQAHSGSRLLTLAVRGPNPHNFFALMLDGLELTLARYPGLKITRLIPCPGHHGESCPHKFRYDQLEKRLNHKPPKLTVECGESFEEMDVRELLFGIGGSTLDKVLEELRKTVKDDEIRHQELLTLLQRQFAKTHEVIQSTVDEWVPNVFTLRSLGTSGIKNLGIWRVN